jgi:hypothetical protein
MFGKKKGFVISRETSFAAKPMQVPAIGREEIKGELKLTVKYERPRWQRLLGADDTFNHSMILDVLGREVYEACDGRQSVRRIIDAFAAKHSISVAEAELAVTKYMKTLIGKGLIAVEVKKDR